MEAQSRQLLGQYELRSVLGEGGLGVVYEAYDQRNGGRVAIKTIRAPDAEFLFQLKHEFRALANLHHKNFIRFGELACERGEWFFTMELVCGKNFVDYVRGACRSPSNHAAPEQSQMRLRSVPPFAHPGFAPSSSSPSSRAFDEVRLRAALAQLIEALSALHDSGHVHCDVKPPNVLVTEEGRLVLLDFGLVHAFRTPNPGLDIGIRGTPAYLAPEQIECAEVGPAADWYAMGIMLFEALTGSRPFAGNDIELLQAKLCEPAPAPSDFADDLPPDLEALCTRLLQTEPELRPTATELRAQFGMPRLQSSPAYAVSSPTWFVGRAHELTVLRDAFRDASEHKPRAVVARGEPGVGKTALVEHFLSGLPLDTVVLRGRCYEQEHVPFAGLDSLIDALTDFLLTLDSAKISELIQGGVRSLAAVFPVLNRVPEIGQTRAFVRAVPNESALREQALGEFCRLMAGIAERRTLVVFLDDLQWLAPEATDFLLGALFELPDTSTLLLASLRPSVALSASASTIVARSTGLELSGLTEADAQALWDKLSKAAGLNQLTIQEREHAIREAAGHPLFLTELLRRARSGRSTQLAGAKLEHVLWERIAEHDEVERALLVACAIAGMPTPCTVLARAAGLDATDSLTRLHVLKAAQLVRVSRDGEERCVEPYHDRIRESVLFHISRTEAHTISALRLRIGRELLAATTDELLPSRVFDILQHLNGARDLVESDAERVRLADLNLLASTEARLATAYERSSEYARIALRLLGPDLWSKHHALASELYIGLFKSEYLAGRRESAEAVFANLRQVIRAVEERARIFEEWIELETGAGRHQQAVACGRKILVELGAPLGTKLTTLDVLTHHVRVRLAQGDRPVGALAALPPMQNERYRGVVRILVAMSPAAYFLDANLTACILMRVIAASLRFGVSEVSWYGFAGYGLVLTGAFGLHEEAHAFGRVALKLNQRFREVPSSNSREHISRTRRARVMFQVATFLSPWVLPFAKVKEDLQSSQQVAAELGDTLYEAYPAGVSSVVAFCEGSDLHAQRRISEWAGQVGKRRHSADMAKVAEAHARYAEALLADALSGTELSVEHSSDAEFRASLSDEETPAALFHYYFCRADLAYLAGDFSQARAFLREARKRNQVNFAVPSAVELCFLSALVCAAQATQSKIAVRLARTAKLWGTTRKLERWARACPQNFESYALIIRAELYRLLGRGKTTTELYDRAIESARRHGATKREAIALERASTHAREVGADFERLNEEARNAYQRWGACAKARTLSKQT